MLLDTIGLNDFHFSDGSLEFDDLNFWHFIIVLAVIFAALLIANALINLIKPLKKSLIPSPVLGGFLLLLFLSIYKWITGKALFNSFILEMITYHCLGLGFVATSLKSNKKTNDEKKKNGAIFNSSLITVSTYLLQGILGIVISIILYYAISSWPASGVLLPMGYGQGPGQAYNWGKTYSELTSEMSSFGQFENGISFGLTVAAMGYVAASIGGVIFLVGQRKKGNIKCSKENKEVNEVLTIESYQDENEISSSGTIDKLSVQFGILVITYILSFGLIYGISKLCDLSGVNLLINTVKPLFWGFNFIFGTAMAILVKKIINGMEKKKVIKKQYINNYMMNRISGLCFDLMVVAAIGAIDFSAFKNPKFVLPLLLICTIGGIATYYYVRHVTKHLYSADGYYEESFLCMYGMLTGTASTGVILLREIDPKFETPACNNMVFQTLYSVLLGAPMLLLMTFIVKNMTNLIIGLVIYIIMFALMFILIKRDKIFKKKQAKEEAR